MARRMIRGAAALYLGVATLLLAATVIPAAAGWRSNLVVTGSMTPRLPAGSVLVTAAAKEAPDVGDIVVVRDPAHAGGTVAHRVVGRDLDGRLILRGDANPAPDVRRVERADVLGVGRLAVPYVGLPAVWARERQWPPLAGWVLLTAAALWALWRGDRRVPDRAPSGRRRPSPAG